MSKSLGNGIDPLDVVERYGADALRYTLVSGMSVGTDVILDPNDLEKSFAPGRNFANKLWNAGRFILSNLDGPPRPLAGAPSAVRRGRADAGRPLDHRAVRRHRPRGHRRLREVPPQRGRGRGVSLSLERSGRLVHRAGQAAPLRRCARRRRRAGGGDADLRRGPAPAPSGDAVRDRGALAAVSRPAAPTPRSRSRRGRGPMRGRRTRPRSPTSGWCSRWWAPSGASGPSTACSRARPSAPT